MNATRCMRMLAMLGVCNLVLNATSSSHAQTYPSKSVRMIVPIAAGGGTDTMARLISQRLSEQLGVTILVDNRA
ncbi:MAG: tripartite tricarboxylate transporter substrate binding protein, partial [Burkholderiales bacterium]